MRRNAGFTLIEMVVATGLFLGRLLETYIRARSDGTADVDSGFKRGAIQFDLNSSARPPPTS